MYDPEDCVLIVSVSAGNEVIIAVQVLACVVLGPLLAKC